MFSVGDYVFNQKNWTPWQSNWLRHQIVKSGYQTTLKVLVVKLETSSHRDRGGLSMGSVGGHCSPQLLLKGGN